MGSTLLPILLLLGLWWLLEKLEPQEIEQALNEIPDISQRVLVKTLLTDESIREYLRQAIAA